MSRQNVDTILQIEYPWLRNGRNAVEGHNKARVSLVLCECCLKYICSARGGPIFGYSVSLFGKFLVKEGDASFVLRGEKKRGKEE